MNFYIHKIQLWFTREDAAPVTYCFEPNKVNVITGDSSTGKSSILRIIDYCLLAEESDIVEDVINESVRYYGISFRMNETDYVIVREAPSFNTPGQKLYWKEDALDFPVVPCLNTSRDYVLDFINNSAGLSDKCLRLSKSKSLKLSFRNFLPFSFLTEDIIAAMNTYFDSKYFVSKDISDNIAKCLDIVIGKDEEREQDLKIKKKLFENKITREKNIKSREEKERTRYEKSLFALVEKAHNLGFYNIKAEQKLPEMIKILYGFISKFKYTYNSDFDVVKLEEVNSAINKTKRKLYRLRLIADEIEKYNEEIDRDSDSLLPLKYLKDQFQQVLLYDETRILIEELSKSLKSIKLSMASRQKRLLPADYQNRYDELTNQMSHLLAEKKRLKEIEVKKLDFDKYENVVALQNELRNLKPIDYRYIGDEALLKLQKELDGITCQYESLRYNDSQCVNRLNDIILEFYNMQHSITSRYIQCKPCYDENRQALVLYNPVSKSYVRNVGSKSNYMFLHLCFFLGLHDLILKQEDSPVPSFLFVDQPSIPYYGGQNKKKDGNISDDDAKKLKDAFSMLNNFITRIHQFGSKKNFQIIMVEHASEDYWANLENFKTNYIFTSGDGLIPERVCKYYK